MRYGSLAESEIKFLEIRQGVFVSFYGAQDLNTSQDNRTNSMKKNKKQGKESFMVPTVYRIGSLHLSEGVSFY